MNSKQATRCGPSRLKCNAFHPFQKQYTSPFLINKFPILFCVFLFLFIVGTQAFAGNDPLMLTMTGQLVEKTVTDGKIKEALTPITENVTPGQVIQYDIFAKNTSDHQLSKVAPEGKIPAGTEYIKDSAKSGGAVIITFSADGGKTFAVPPLKRKIVRPDGTETEQVIPVSEYTGIRFSKKALKSGESFTGTYRVIVK